jgi:hypothetical protein
MKNREIEECRREAETGDGKYPGMDIRHFLRAHYRRLEIKQVHEISGLGCFLRNGKKDTEGRIDRHLLW